MQQLSAYGVPDPVFIHNFRGYDGNLNVQSFSQYPNRKIKIIGPSMERYLQVAWGDNIVFRDSFQHLSCSLERLVESLTKVGEHKFKQLAHIAAARYGPLVEMKLLTRKGVSI